MILAAIDQATEKSTDLPRTVGHRGITACRMGYLPLECYLNSLKCRWVRPCSEVQLGLKSRPIFPLTIDDLRNGFGAEWAATGIVMGFGQSASHLSRWTKTGRRSTLSVAHMSPSPKQLHSENASRWDIEIAECLATK